MAGDIRRRSRNELFHVSDPEYSRFGLFDGNRALMQPVEVESLKVYTERFPDERLEHLRKLELQLLELMHQVIESDGS